MPIVLRHNIIRDPAQIRVALVFGFGGLVPGVFLSYIVSAQLVDFSSLPAGNPGHFPSFLVWPGAFLLIGLSTSLAICWSLQWLKVRVSIWRRLFATILVIPISLCATAAGEFGAVAAACFSLPGLSGFR
jgi:hypothetical protein